MFHFIVLWRGVGWIILITVTVTVVSISNRSDRYLVGQIRRSTRPSRGHRLVKRCPRSMHHVTPISVIRGDNASFNPSMIMLDAVPIRNPALIHANNMCVVTVHVIPPLDRRSRSTRVNTVLAMCPATQHLPTATVSVRNMCVSMVPVCLTLVRGCPASTPNPPPTNVLALEIVEVRSCCQWVSAKPLSVAVAYAVSLANQTGSPVVHRTTVVSTIPVFRALV